MSGAPTKGMVAGKQIKTGDLTRGYEQGYERAFPAREGPKGGRWRWDAASGRLVPLNAGWTDAPRKLLDVTGDAVYQGATSPVDGTPIDTRRRYREYLQATGLTHADDFKGEWAKAAEERAQPTIRDPARRDDVGRAMYQIEKAHR